MSVMYGVQRNVIVKNGEFCWHPEMKEPKVRDRSLLDVSSRKFEFVAPEEISQAILQQVKRGFSLSLDDAVSNAARVLGFQRVTAQAKYLFDQQLDGLIKSEVLILRNGSVSVA
ncbi:MAG: hypothetical protein HKK67_08925 [Chlorobiaceae bacterium]|nr:hypothetical protein [Chlorobiaceae bacterium]